MSQFPQMLYRAPGAEDIHGHKLASLIVHDADDLERALADGWHETTTAAVQAHRDSLSGQTGTTQATVAAGEENGARSTHTSSLGAEAAVASNAPAASEVERSHMAAGGGDVDDNAPPTRAELEQKAHELGIKFDGRIGDKRLAALIEKHLKG